MHEHIHEVERYIVSAVPAIWISTYEEKRTMAMLSGLRDEREYTIIEWDILNYARVRYASPNDNLDEQAIEGCEDPVTMLNKFTAINNQGLILVMHDMHRFMPSAEVVRAIKHFVNLEQSLKHIIFMSHKNAIPEELEKDILLAHIKLPEKTDIESILNAIIETNDISCDVHSEHIRAILGLTEQEVKNALALNLSEDLSLNREKLEKFKLEAVKKSGMMEIFNAVPESDLGGLNALKAYMHLRAKGFEDDSLPTPTGILLMGLPGGGKSLSAKVIASILKMPLIKLDIASLKSKFVGESESKMGQALNLIDAVSPAVVWLDKVLSRINCVNC